jgi:hypothetical protein
VFSRSLKEGPGASQSRTGLKSSTGLGRVDPDLVGIKEGLIRGGALVKCSLIVGVIDADCSVRIGLGGCVVLSLSRLTCTPPWIEVLGGCDT